MYPVLSFFPAVRLARNLELGEWVIGVPADTVQWRAAPFRELATLLFQPAERDFETRALVWHRERGFDGSSPTDEEARAIQAAVRFALLDYNDQVTGNLNAAHYLATSENGVLYRQPIDEAGRSVAHVSGGALKGTLIGGWKIGERPLAFPDATQPIARPVWASQKLAAAVFDALSVPGPVGGELAIAVEWHAVALANPPAVTLQQRLVSLKIGFEALFGEEKSWECAAALRTLFENTTRPYHALLPWAGCLWSPTERKDLSRSFTRNGKKVLVLRSELEDWFIAFADVRNTIVHEGRTPTTVFPAPVERPLSRYAGEFFWKGERILREAIKAMLGADVLLCGLLAQRKRYEELAPEIFEWFAANSAEAPSTLDAPRVSLRPAKPLTELLAALGCGAANCVQMHKEVQERLAGDNEFEEFWIAEAGPIELAIDETEKDLLKQAGAEDKLREDFEPCD